MTYLFSENVQRLGSTTYLADGLYAGHDGFQVWLWTERDGRGHEIALEPAALIALNIYLTDILGKEI